MHNLTCTNTEDNRSKTGLAVDPSITSPVTGLLKRVQSCHTYYRHETSCRCIIIIMFQICPPCMIWLFKRVADMRLRSWLHSSVLYISNRLILFCKQFFELHFPSAVHVSVGGLAGQVVLGLSQLQN